MLNGQAHLIRLVSHICKKYYAKTNDADDLISIGTIGLIKAVDSFDYSKGTRFSTYASRCVENEILMYFRSLKKQNGEIFLGDAIDSDKDGNPLTAESWLDGSFQDAMEAALSDQIPPALKESVLLFARCTQPFLRPPLTYCPTNSL